MAGKREVELSFGGDWMGKMASGECPHCGVYVAYSVRQSLAEKVERRLASSDENFVDDTTEGLLHERQMELRIGTCPACSEIVIDLISAMVGVERHGLYPALRFSSPPSEVSNKEIRLDYTEAHAVRRLSRRAAAALGRRALQGALREQGFNRGRLVDEINDAMKDPRTPATLGEKLHFVREVGNDAAHPNEDHAGEIIDVTGEDLEMLFAALDEFFEVFYVRPARHRKLMDARRTRTKGND